ncbi:MAG: transcriptional regulator [Lentisphaerae bacterium]|nr:transcriptional regulator [Lentisphaerota bacterium]
MSPAAPIDAEPLERIFHEPNRLAILSAVCGQPGGMRFKDLRDACRLTDGNLNRHLKVLEEARVIRVAKQFVDGKPCTTIHLSKTGLKRFQDYLAALEQVLLAAQQALPAESRARAPLLGRVAPA